MKLPRSEISNKALTIEETHPECVVPHNYKPKRISQIIPPLSPEVIELSLK